MYILALETSGKAGSIAAADGQRLIAEEALNPDQRAAQSMAPAVGKLLAAIGWRITDVRLIAVTIGPGSFTGLRVGVATAKTLAYAIGALAVGVSTLDVIAAQASCAAPRLSVALDAQRGQVFNANYERAAPGNGTHWRLIDGPRLQDNEQWLNSLAPGMVASGPALVKLSKHIPTAVTLVGAKDWAPRATAVAELAWARHLRGAHDDVWKLSPLYLRKSAAEEQLDVLESKL